MSARMSDKNGELINNVAVIPELMKALNQSKLN